MANCCWYTIKVVSENRAALERFEKIMDYKDPEMYIYRVRDFDDNNDVETVGNLFTKTYYGEVAWSAHSWFHDKPDPGLHPRIAFEKNPDGSDNWDKPIYGTSSYTNLIEVCKALGINLEMWSDECGCEFQEHAFVARDGTFWYDSVHWEEGYNPETEEPDEEYDVGGFEDYCICKSAEEIWAFRELKGDEPEHD